MTSTKRRLSFALVGLCLTGFGAAAQAQSCKPAHQFETIRPGTLSVAVWDFPPYSIPAGTSDIKGVDGEIVKQIAARECLKIAVSVIDPAAVVQAINTSMNRALSQQAVKARLQELTMNVVADSTPASAKAFLDAEIAKWEPIIRSAGITANG